MGNMCKDHCLRENGKLGLIRVFNAIGHKFRRLGDENLTRKGVTFSQLHVLVYLLHRQGEEGALQRNLEEALGIRRSSVTAILQNMEKTGLVRRESVLGDARQKRVFPTEKAEALDRELRSYMDQLEEEISMEFTDEERQQLDRYLLRILTKLDTMESMK